MRFAVGIEYDGSRYYGWQIQQSEAHPTVAAQLEKAISQVADHPVTVHCAGRTDKAVHATGQVIHFDTTANRQIYAWLQGINYYLPPTIRASWVMPVDMDFHARFSAKARQYLYIIYNHICRPAILHEKVTWFRFPLDEKRMQQASVSLLGEHDFSSYRATGCQAKSPIRRVDHLEITRKGNYILVDIKANAFLHHMVRNITGVLMAIGTGKQDITWTREVLEAKDRAMGGVTAPPSGLYLVHVEYPQQYGLPNAPVMPMVGII